jgi:HAD domain in Swiss Army Knife RNA repair proteins
MKVIFLDIDGVLNTTNSRKPSKDAKVIEPLLLARLRSLLADTGAQTVLSSTWRHEPDGLACARRLGVLFSGVLPDLRPRPRNEEIIAWLKTHRDVERFVVIDDDDDCLDAFPLFQPVPSSGLTDKMAKAAADYLNEKSDKDMRRNRVVRLLQNAVAYLKGHNG